MPRTHYYSLEGFWNFDILLLFSFFFSSPCAPLRLLFLFSVLLLVAFQCFFNNSFLLLSLTFFFHLSLSMFSKYSFHFILSFYYELDVLLNLFLPISIPFNSFSLPSYSVSSLKSIFVFPSPRSIFYLHSLTYLIASLPAAINFLAKQL